MVVVYAIKRFSNHALSFAFHKEGWVGHCRSGSWNKSRSC